MPSPLTMLSIGFVLCSGVFAIDPRQATPTSSDICSVTAYAAVPAATASCTSITLESINVPGDETLDLSKLKTGTTVTFAGTTTFDFFEGDYNLIEVGGTNITITANPDAVIDGNGQAWWDGQGSNGGIAKPDHFFVVSKALGNSVIKDLYIQNYPVHCFSISGSAGLVMENIVLNNTAGNAPNNRSAGLPAAHNTDGFDISSSNDTVLRGSTVVNQDDCVAVTSGDHITVSEMLCNGGHGLSIGSVGGKSDNNVTNILFEDSQILNSQNGARIKTNSDTTGFIANITYRNIQVQNISIYGIDIQQDYLNGGPTGEPTNGVVIQNVTMTNITGTAESDAKDYYILCGEESCSDFTFDDIGIVGGTNSSCNVLPEGDFSCSP
ncbi:Uu.00g073090.m01.CDS01 [Anthostomella pinea]|uniref:endo-polygalacturonase n=1 Tax=Anthostomella pinea TaxID=933095 RepID=A0AAI8VVZ5_9PEZI|nr:Uu.00g073090.m01.CDS01 [Anthostomella pinea]